MSLGINRRDVLKALGATGSVAAGAGVTLDDHDDGRVGRGSTELKLFHDTHVHGHIGDADENRNVENYFGLMDHLAAGADAALRLGNGDDLGSSALSIEFGGRQTVDAFEAGNLDYDTLGNHDFDFGPETARRRIAESDFEWVTGNVVDEDGDVFGHEQGVQAYDIVDVEGVSVGITGMLTTEAEVTTSLGSNRVQNPITALGDVVRDMRYDGAQVVIVLSHVANGVARNVARVVDGIDVIVGDDAASDTGVEEIGDTILGFVGDEYEFLGEMTLQIAGNGNQVRDYEYAMHDVEAAVDDLEIEPNEDVKIVADSYRNRLESEVIGRTEVPLNCRTEDNRTEETNMGNFATDTIRQNVGADVAVQNGGGIRTDTLYSEGELTDLVINQIFPFGNTIVELEVSGETLLEALENGVSQVEQVDGRFLQVSGMSYEWDPEAAVGDRIESVAIGGEDVDESATYTLGTNGFMAGGGDGFDMLTDAPTVEEGAEISTAVIERIRAESPIAPEVEGRITRV